MNKYLTVLQSHGVTEDQYLIWLKNKFFKKAYLFGIFFSALFFLLFLYVAFALKTDSVVKYGPSTGNLALAFGLGIDILFTSVFLYCAYRFKVQKPPGNSVVFFDDYIEGKKDEAALQKLSASQWQEISHIPRQIKIDS